MPFRTESEEKIILELAFEKAGCSNPTSTNPKRIGAGTLNIAELTPRTTGVNIQNGQAIEDPNYPTMIATADMFHGCVMPMNPSSATHTSMSVQEAENKSDGSGSIENFGGISSVVTLLAGNDVSYYDNEKPVVFLTYGDETSKNSVHEIFHFLKDNHVKPCVDFLEEKYRRSNVNQWLNDRIDKSSFIIVCVNSKYKNFVEEQRKCENENKNDAVAVDDRLQSLYIENGCLNYNIIPVLIDGAKFSSLPWQYKATTVYRWPEKKSELLDRIFKRD